MSEKQQEATVFRLERPGDAQAAMQFDDQVLRLAIKAGQKMLEAGAETYRVEETMEQILRLSGTTGHAYAVMTGISASIDQPGQSPKTLLRRTAHRSVNLYAIHSVNQISRDLVSRCIRLEEADERLDEIDTNHYSTSLKNIATIFMSGGFALLLSGHLPDAWASFFNGIIIMLVIHFTRITKTRAFLTNVLAGFFAAFTGRLIQAVLFPSADYDIVIAGSLMLLFPGTAITNAIRDTLNGDYVSGSARALEAFMVAISLAIGTGVGLWFTRGIWAW